MTTPLVAVGAIQRNRGYEVTEAANVKEALVSLEKTDFDFVITDLVMSDEKWTRLIQ
jgi:CheY-like chemotaxis protein